MKIALIAYMHGNGGAERQISKLSNELAQMGHCVQMLVLAEYNLKYHISDSVFVQNLTYAEKSGIHPIIGRFYALRKAYKSFRPDVTIHFNYQSVYLTILNRKTLRGKIIFAERGDPTNKSDYTLPLRILRFFTNIRTDGFVFQTRGAQSFFNQRTQKRSIVIPNSVAVKEGVYSKVNNREKKIVSSGRLHPQKNQALLISAFSKIASRYPDYTLEIYGDGELREELSQQIKVLGLENRVLLKGVVKNIFEVTRSATLFVLSSDYEGMPNALMEAMALGVPCISTDCSPGGARDLIDEGVNGWITPIKDVDSLADRMAFVLSHLDIAEEVATNAMKITSTHTDESVFAMWDQFISRVVK